MAFSIGGLASGLDTASIVEKLVQLERQPIQKLEGQISKLQSIQSVYTSLTTGFIGVQTAARNLSPQKLDQPTVTNGNETAVGVSASSDALDGDHDLIIQQLATAHRIGSQGFEDGHLAPISSSEGTFTVQVGDSGSQISVAVTASTTLNELATAINAADGDVVATVVNDGTVADSYSLVLTSKTTGRNNDIQISSNPTDLEFDNPTIEEASVDTHNAGTYTGTVKSDGTFTGTSRTNYIVQVILSGAAGEATYKFSENGGITWDDNGGAGYGTTVASTALGSDGVTIAFSDGGTLSVGDRFYIDVSVPELQEAKDAVFTLDGIPQTRESNTVSDALDGVTLSLHEADSTSTLKFSLGRSDQVVKDNLQAFVDAYNTLSTSISSKQFYDPDTKETGLLLGDTTTNKVQAMLNSALVEASGGVGTGLRRLVDIGISTNEDGSLSLDTSTLQSALDDDRDQVLKVLGSTEATSSVDLEIGFRPKAAEAGTYDVYVTTPASKGQASANQAMEAPLDGDEFLTFTYTNNATAETPTIDTFTVELSEDDNLTTVVNTLNSAFATQGANIVAYADGTMLKFESTFYGADEAFTVVSDRDEALKSTGVGTAIQSGTGVDIVGTINGATTTGDGTFLKVDSENSDLDGLGLDYLGTGTGLVGTFTLTTGASSRFDGLIEDIHEGSSSVIGIRNKGIQRTVDMLVDEIKSQERRVATVQQRIQARFVALEKAMASLNSQALFLTNQLTSLSNNKK